MTEPEIEIRRATPQDAPAITAITEEAYSKYIPLIGRKPQPMMVDYERMVVENDTWLLSFNEQPAGVLVLIRHPEYLLVFSVAVRPGFQQHGLGRRLLSLAEVQAKLAGYTTICLYTNEKFEDNLRMYEKMGYQETRREPLLGSMVIHMSKDIQ